MALQTVKLRDGVLVSDTLLATLDVYRLSNEAHMLDWEPFTQAESTTQSSKGTGLYLERFLEFEVFVETASLTTQPTELLALRADVVATKRLESLDRFILIDRGVGIRSWRRASVAAQDGEKEGRDGFVARVAFIAADTGHVWTAFGSLTSPADDGIGVV